MVEIGRILLADAHTCSRVGLNQVLTDAGFTVVAETDSLDEIDTLLRAHWPDLLLLADNLLPDFAAQFLRELCLRWPETAVVLFLANQTQWPLMALSAAGASGLIAKTEPVNAIAQAVQGVAAGHATISPHLLAGMAAHPDDLPEGGAKAALTPQEESLLQHLCAGQSNPEIAQALNLSRKTIEKRLTALYAKLGVNTRTGAAAWYLARCREDVPAQKSREFPPEM